MASLQATGIADLVTTTINELGELKVTDVMSDYNKTIFFKRVVKKNKIVFDAGPRVEFNLMTGTNATAEFKGLYAQDTVSPNNVMTTGAVDWRHVGWNWAIERRELAMNRTPRKIVDLATTRRVAALGSAIELFERRGWRGPASTDTVNPHGIQHWIVKNNTEGFNGGAPSGYTTVADISPTTYARWKNWTAQYTAVTKDDFVRKVRRAMYETDFERLVDDMSTYNTGDDLAGYANYELVRTLEELLETQNDNLGMDLASTTNKVVILGIPIMAIPELANDTTNPLYLINWGEFKTFGLRGEWMRETVEPQVAGQHTVAATFTDCSLNWICRNRRRNSVIATDTTAMS